MKYRLRYCIYLCFNWNDQSILIVKSLFQILMACLMCERNEIKVEHKNSQIWQSRTPPEIWISNFFSFIKLNQFIIPDIFRVLHWKCSAHFIFLIRFSNWMLRPSIFLIWFSDQINLSLYISFCFGFNKTLTNLTSLRQHHLQYKFNKSNCTQHSALWHKMLSVSFLLLCCVPSCWMSLCWLSVRCYTGFIKALYELSYGRHDTQHNALRITTLSIMTLSIRKWLECATQQIWHSAKHCSALCWVS